MLPQRTGVLPSALEQAPSSVINYKIFVWFRAFFALDPDRLYLFPVLSSTMQLNPLASGSSFMQLTETFVLLQQKFKFYPHIQSSGLRLTHIKS